jgi:imidazolonepropionase
MSAGIVPSHGKPEQWLLIRGARQLLTLHGPAQPRRGPQLAELAVIPDGSVLVRNGIIEAVGPTRRLENVAEARMADEIDASGRVVMPAFIDPHAYLIPHRAPRSEEDSGISRSSISRAVQALPATRLSAQADQRLKLMARHGTATVGALSGYGCDDAGEAKILRAVASRNQQPLDVVSIVHWIGDGCREQIFDLAVRRKLAGIASARCGEGGCETSEAVAFLEAARAAGLAVQLEIPRECDHELAEAAVALDAVSLASSQPPKLLAAETIAQSNVTVTLTPGARWTDEDSDAARRLIGLGAAVALGSGMNPETGGPASMQSVMRLMAERKALSLEEAITCATVNAAYALGQGGETGTLEHGKRADLILLEVSDYREISFLPGTNVTHSLVKRGAILFEEEFPGWPQKD